MAACRANANILQNMQAMSPIHLEQIVSNVQEMADFLSNVPHRLERALDQALAGRFRGYASFGVHELVVTLWNGAAAGRRDWTTGSTREFLEAVKADKRERVGMRLDAMHQREQREREQAAVVVADQTQSPARVPVHRDGQEQETASVKSSSASSASSKGSQAQKTVVRDMIATLACAAAAAAVATPSVPTAAVSANHAIDGGVHFVNKPTPSLKPAASAGVTATAKVSTAAAVAPKSK